MVRNMAYLVGSDTTQFVYRAEALQNRTTLLLS